MNRTYLSLGFAAMLTACGQTSDTTALAALENVTVREVARSRINAGGQIQISHSLPKTLVAEQTVTVILNFHVQPYQNLEVDITPSEDFELLTDPVTVLQGSDSGRLQLSVQLLPFHAGKSYLKFIAATIDGESIRSYVVPLTVTDSLGNLPESPVPAKRRIDLPSISR